MEKDKGARMGKLTINADKPAVFGRVEAKSHQDLLKAGITVHPNYVADRWGPAAAAEYSKAVAQRIAKSRG